MDNNDELVMGVVSATGMIALSTMVLLGLPIAIGQEIASRKGEGSKTETITNVATGMLKTTAVVAGTCIWIHWVVKKNTQ